MPGLILRHTIVGREELVNFTFDSDKPFRACMLCGDVYQTDADRAITEDTPLSEVALVYERRQTWAEFHARSMHTTYEHRRLMLSGMTCTPEAAEKLVVYGIAPVSDMVLSDEHAHAALQAPRAPSEDAQDG